MKKYLKLLIFTYVIIAGIMFNYVFAFDSEEYVTINPETAHTFGIRVFVIDDKYSSNFVIKSMAKWKDLSYRGTVLTIKDGESYVRSYGAGCFADGIYTYNVNISNENLSKTHLSLEYSNSNRIRNLIIDFNSFKKYISDNYKNREDFWINGVGTPIAKKYKKYFEKRSKKCGHIEPLQ